ncbi:MAG: hypothetical protein PUA90_05665 [bacterium]|nr:hypothetical protein [bacterium]
MNKININDLEEPNKQKNYKPSASIPTLIASDINKGETIMNESKNNLQAGEMIRVNDLFIIEISKLIGTEYEDGQYYPIFDKDNCYYTIAKLKSINSDSRSYSEIFGENIFYEIVKKFNIYIGNRVVSDAVSVVSVMDKVDERISKEELSNILKTKNRRILRETDYFLQSVLSVASKVSSSSLSVEEKDDVTNQLMLLSDEYVSALITLKEGGYESSNNEVSELKIKERFFKKLIEIEQNVNLYSNVTSRDLLDSREEVKRLLK